MTTITGSARIGGTTYTATADLILPGPSGLIGSSTELPFPVTVPAMASYRHYFQAGDFSGSGQPRYGIGQEARLREAYETYGVRLVHVSCKERVPVRTKLLTFFASCPPDLKFICTNWHEHEAKIRDGTLTYQQYLDYTPLVAGPAHEAGHWYGPNHNGINRRDSLDPNDTSPWGLWPDRWREVEAPVELCDVWTFDYYPGNYQVPATHLAPVLSYQAEHGLPLGIGETATPNSDPAKQATWAGRMRTWSLDHTVYACWWQNQFSGKPPYPMTADTCRAWFAL